jgi:hypothetical protein
MDAISFVLGVKSSQLRGSALRDLVYSNDEDAADVRRRAFVTCVYVTAQGEEMHFTRVISPEGTSSYKFNGRNCSWEDYNTKLQSQGILIKARNFLVFQVSNPYASPKTLAFLQSAACGTLNHTASAWFVHKRLDVRRLDEVEVMCVLL